MSDDESETEKLRREQEELRREQERQRLEIDELERRQRRIEREIEGGFQIDSREGDVGNIEERKKRGLG